MLDSGTMTFFPPRLRQGGRVGLVSPSKWAEASSIRSLQKRLKERGYDVFVHPQNQRRSGWFAGTAGERAKALMDVFLDPDIDAVMCARGGTGAMHLLDRLDYEVIRKNPKPLIGFSDMTCLLNAVTRKTGMVTYHGPMGWSFDEPQFHSGTLDDLLRVVADDGPLTKLSFPQARTVREGSARASLVGGNLSLLQCLAGTDCELKTERSVLFIEDVEEPLYKLDRALAHLRLAGRFDGVAAVLVGEMVGIEDEFPNPDAPPEAWFGKGIEEIFLEHLPPSIPVAFNVPCGHGKYLTTFPVGADVEVEFCADGVSMTVARP